MFLTRIDKSLLLLDSAALVTAEFSARSQWSCIITWSSDSTVGLVHSASRCIVGYSSSFLTLSFPQSICEWVKRSLSLSLSLSLLVVLPTKDESGPRTALLWDVDKNTTTIKAPDNKHMQRTAAAKVCLCRDVLVEMIRLLWGIQRGCEKDCTLSAPAGSAAMQQGVREKH